MKLLRKVLPTALAGLILLLTACPPPTQTPATVYYGSLIISEVGSCPYINISSWIEVYNNTAQAAQLSDFQLRTYGRLKASAYDFIGITSFSLPSLVVQPGSYVLIHGRTSDNYVNGNQIVYIDNGTLVPNWYNDNITNGSGNVELVKNGATIDFVRFGSNVATPLTASAWIGGGDAPALPTGIGNYGWSIARAAALTDTNTAVDWGVSVGIATAGGPNDVTTTADADYDGIPDANEAPGTTFAGLPLNTWGASAAWRDIFIHIDYMNSADPGVTPRKEALDMVVAAFLAQGIRVHFDVGTLFSATPDPANYNLDNTSHQVPFAIAVTVPVTNPLPAGVANLYQYKNTYMSLAKKQIFHYLLMGYSQNADGSGGSSGIAELPGNDFTVTLGNCGLNTSDLANTNALINFQASTIMHELGHNLFLQHGGNVSTNYKPNYFSIMNYMYQLYGLSTIGNNEGDRYYIAHKKDLGDSVFATHPITYATLTNSFTTSTFVMNYSNGSGGTISEGSADELSGLLRAGSTSIDFNGIGGVTGPVPYDLNYDGSITGTFSDYNDWANINLFFQRGRWGDESGVTGPDALKIAVDPVGDDRQPVIVETLRPIIIKK
jgi:hypothetical protein